jgi:hypothetical protein
MSKSVHVLNIESRVYVTLLWEGNIDSKLYLKWNPVDSLHVSISQGVIELVSLTQVIELVNLAFTHLQDFLKMYQQLAAELLSLFFQFLHQPFLQKSKPEKDTREDKGKKSMRQTNYNDLRVN